MATFFGIWNLDFFRAYDQRICLGLGSLSNLFLDLAVAVYPLILVALTYVLIFLYDRNYKILILAWKPFHFFLGWFYQKLSVKTSVLNSITTSLFLVNIKVLSVCFDALTPVRVYQFYSSGCIDTSWRLFYDPIHYFSHEHRFYAATAVIILFLFYICPVFFLLFHSCNFFKFAISILPHRVRIVYNTFMDSIRMVLNLALKTVGDMQ